MYEYKCAACDHRFEVIQKFSDKPVKKCPHCGRTGKAVERLVSTSAIKFKGTGWYVTDYAKRSSPTDTKSEPKPEKETVAAKETAPAAATASEKPAKAKESSSTAPPSPAKK
jgi:putative FmdB family regulatory protein